MSNKEKEKQALKEKKAREHAEKVRKLKERKLGAANDPR